MVMGAFFSLSAQHSGEDWTQSYGTLDGFTVGNKYYTFVTDANLREQSNTQAKVIAKLPIGTPVTIEAVSTDSLTLRGIKMPWLKVRCNPGSGAVSGFVWGGFMALAHIQTPNDEYTPNAGALYLTGVAAYDEMKHEITVQVRIALNGKELSKTEFTTNGDLSYYPDFSVSFEPYQNVKAVLTVNYFYPACGYPSGNNLLFWQSNNQLTKVLETTSISDAGVFYDSEDYILPSQRGGIGDHLLLVKDASQFEERGNDMVRTAQTIKVVLYKWTGSKLVKIKELK